MTYPVSTPGVYDLAEDVYHGDPVEQTSLSVSGAKRLLPPSCPALFFHERTHGRPDRRTFDFGHAAHKLVLGVGLDVVVIEAENYRTKAAQEQQQEARARGAAPLLTAEWATVQAMAAALREHPIAAALLTPESGTPESSLFWVDEQSGIWRRGRVDWLPKSSDGRLIITDYKTAVTAEPDAFGRTAPTYGYHMQAPWYIDGVKALGLAEDAAFVFVVQEKTAPFLVSVIELDSLALRVGRERNRRAIDTYVQCMTSGEWPGYTNDVALVSLPVWAEREYEQETA